MTIRPAVQLDEAAVLALVPQLRSFGPHTFRSAEALDAGEARTLSRFFAEHPAGTRLWVAEANGAVVGAAYWYERTHRRWSAQNHPLTVPRARLERARTAYRDRRAFVTEVAQAIRQSGLPAVGPGRSG